MGGGAPCRSRCSSRQTEAGGRATRRRKREPGSPRGSVGGREPQTRARRRRAEKARSAAGGPSGGASARSIYLQKRGFPKRYGIVWAAKKRRADYCQRDRLDTTFTADHALASFWKTSSALLRIDTERRAARWPPGRARANATIEGGATTGGNTMRTSAWNH